VDEVVDLGECSGAANPGAEVITLVSAMALGADPIDDCNALRVGRRAQCSAIGWRRPRLENEGAKPSRVGV
jgi:hypothetical protein